MKNRTSIIALLTFFFSVMPFLGFAQAPTPGDPGTCFVVADEGNTANAPGSGTTIGDTLYVIDRRTGLATLVGNTGTAGIEAIAFNVDDGNLYAFNDVAATPAVAGQLVILDFNNGGNTVVGTDVGSANGVNGPFVFNDIDSLTFDYSTSPATLYGTQRINGGGADLLVKINTATGLIDQNGFGPGVGYVEVGTTATEDNVDDIAIDCQTGQMYGILNNGDNTTPDLIAEIDKSTGAIANPINTGIFDLEGLTFGGDGVMFGSTGANGTNSGGGASSNSQNSTYSLGIPGQPGFGVATDGIRVVDENGVEIGYDFESLGCFVAPPNVEVSQRILGDASVGCACDSTGLVQVVITAVDVTLDGITVVNNALSGCNVTVPTLAPGESFTNTCLVGATFQNTVTVSAGDCFNRTATSTVSTNFNVAVDVIPPVINVLVPSLEIVEGDCAYTVPDYPATGEDDCSDVSLAVTQNPPAGTVIQGPASFDVVFTTTDACGNVGAYTQSVCIACSDVAEPLQYTPGTCFLVADEGNSPAAGSGAGTPDIAYVVDPLTGAATELGPLGVNGVEAIVWDAANQQLLGENGGELGVIDITTGAFTSIGSAGSADGALGNLPMDDIDSLTFDYSTTPPTLYGVNREGADNTPDLLVQIDPATGAIVPDAFGAGVDYVLMADDGIRYNIDDIAINPCTGSAFAIMNDDGIIPDNLIQFNLATGALITNFGDIGVDDVEGLSFTPDGLMIGSTGNNQDPDANFPEPNSTFALGFETDADFGTGRSITRVLDGSGNPLGYDFEALACYQPLPQIGIQAEAVGDCICPNEDVPVTITAFNIPTPLTEFTITSDFCTFPMGEVPSCLVTQQTCVVSTPVDTNVTFTLVGVDKFGNAVTAEVSVVIDIDEEAPVLSGVPADVTAPCDAIPDAPTVSASDICDNNVTVELEETPVPGAVCPQSFTIERVWTATDVCGNSVSATQVVTVVDTLPPVLVTPEPLCVVGGRDCSYTVPSFTTTVSDNCDTDITLQQDPPAGTVVQGPATITVTLQANDDCGNEDEVTFPIEIKCFDLALDKVLSTPGPYTPGDTVTFDITVENQGSVTATSIVVVDYPPAGLTLNDAAWSGTPPAITIPGPLAPGDSQPLSITFTIDPGTEGTLINFAEIASALDTDGDPAVDIDSIPNTTNGDDAGGQPGSPADNFVDGDGTGAPGDGVAATDEDDHDPAQLIVEPNAVSIGSTVFLDPNDNGLQDAGEDGIPGVTVELRDTAGTVLDSTVTDADGDYFFGDLDEGDYVVVIPTPPADAPLSSTPTASEGLDNQQDGDDNGAQAASGDPVTSPVITLTDDGEPTGEAEQGGTQDVADDNNGDMTVDFGFVPVHSIGSTVFLDPNDNGEQDAGEMGISGVTVELRDTAGNLLDTTTTDANGDYLFDNLLEGQYVVIIPTPPADAPLSSGPTDTSDNQQDGDDNGTQAALGDPTTSPVITLTNNGEPTSEPDQGGTQDDADDNNGDMTIDFGFVPLVSIGSTVFLDPNDNGEQDAGEPGIPGVTVELRNFLGTVLDTTVTDGNGDYFFGELPQGNYVVVVPTPPADAPLSSTTTDTADNQEDGDDNGSQPVSGAPATSPLIALTVDGEPTGETEQGGTQDAADDNNGDMTVDFGFVPLHSLGSTVFLDPNDNGEQDAGEDGIPGVTVELRDTAGSLVETTTTDANGDYLFEDLLEGDYVVVIPTPPEEAPKSSTPTDTADNQEDGDDNGTQAAIGDPTTSPVINLSNNAEPTGEPDQGGAQDAADDNNGDMTVDFGFVPLVSIGSTVFLDPNDNGEQDAGEDGIPGVTVELRDTAGALVDSTVTDADGDYFFDELLEGDYVVVIPTPPADAPLSSTPTDTADNQQDGDDNGTQAASGDPVSSPVITLTADDEPTFESEQGGTQDAADDNNGDMTIDFGFVPVHSLGSTVFLDPNDNGEQDAGEDGIPGVLVELRDTAGNLVDSTTTDANGDYLFEDLLEGDYVVVIPTPPADAPKSSTPTDTADNQEDGDDNGTQAAIGDPTTSPVITLSNNGEPTGEPDQGGAQDAADDDNGDMTVDFGFVPLVSIGSTVFLDPNDNGEQDAGEPGIPGVPVELEDAAGNPVDSTVTDANGDYLFDELLEGDYVVVIPTPPADAPKSSTPTDTADNQEDGDDNGTQVAPGDETTSPVITLTANGEPTGEPDQGGAQDAADDDNGDMTVDFGFVPLVSLGSTVFLDTNDNGEQDAGEPGIPGVPVELEDAAGNPVDSTVTDANGDYLFEELLEGDYVVVIPTPPADAPLSSTTTDTADNQEDGDDNGTQAMSGDETTSPVITLTANGEPTGETEQGGAQDAADDDNGDMTVDFGFVPVLSIGSTVFLDPNDNGEQDAGEPGVAGVTLELRDTAGNLLDTTVTDGNGDYLFDELLEGDYVVVIPAPPASAPDSSTPTDTADNQEDGDDNGDQPGGTGAEITSPVITLTNNMEPTGEAAQGGMQDAADDDNGDMTVDFGLVPMEEPVSIGSTVFLDPNDNGEQDAGEAGIPNVPVELQDPAGNVIASTVTDGNGDFIFSGLAPGDYVLVIPTPPASAPDSSTPTDPADNGEDGDDNGDQPGGTGTPISSPVITLEPGTEPTSEPDQGGTQDDAADEDGDMTVDFGLVPVDEVVSIGSTVFLDPNDNGEQDAGEPGIPNVPVQLQDDAGNVVDSTVTDADGNYLFEDLEEGDYVVVIPTPPADAPLSSTVTDSADNGEDGDDNGEQPMSGDPTTSPVITLTAGSEPTDEPEQGGTQDDAADENGDMTVDFGFVPVLSLGSTVFLDPNDNGEQDAGEPGIAGVTVELQDTAGNVLETTTTDANGDYLFEDLLEGDYVVVIPAPPASAPDSSTPTDTADNGEDGDDNGSQPGGTGTPISSPVITLENNMEPTGESAQGGLQDLADDDNGDMTVDFGLVPPDEVVSLGSTVFLDVNDNGEQDATEDGIPGVVVELQDPAGNVVDSTVTDVDGNYLFDDIAEGDYIVVIPAPPMDAPLSSTTTDTADNGEDGDDNGSQPMSGDPTTSPVITLTAGTEPTDEPEQGGTQDDAADENGDMTVDFGFVPVLSIGSTVFLDPNDNGEQDAGESGVAGVTLELQDTAGNVLDTTMTDGNGDYLFENLLEGDYVVVIPAPPASAPDSSTPTDTADNGEDGDDNGDQPGGTGTPITSPVINLSNNMEPTGETGQGGMQDAADDDNGEMTIDFGLVPVEEPVSLGSTVFLDPNDNGEQDAGEDGVPGVTVELQDPAGNVIASTVTDGNGDFIFNGLAPGDYVLVIPMPPASSPDSSTPTDTADNGEDGDDNGDQPGGTGTPISSPVITLDPGTEPAGEPGQGGTQDAAADDNGDMTVDFGLVPAPEPVSLGSTVFLDPNDNGEQDAGEDGIPGVTVELQDTAGNVVDTTVTDGDGNFLFEDLPAGDYVLVIPTPPATAPDSSTPTDTADNGEDGDDNGDQPGGTGTPVTSPVITLEPGTEPTGEPGPGGTQDDAADENGDMTVDFGFVPPEEPVSLGSTVFLDPNDNGEQDAGEDGIPGVTVELQDTAGNVVDTTVTDGDGNFLFEDLPAGDYVLVIPTPPATAPDSSTPTDTADNGEDGDDNGDQPGGTGTPVTSPVITLEPGTEPTGEPGPGGTQDDAADDNGDMTVDFGFVGIFDLALTKVLTSPANVVPGDTVTFDIEVTNQGTIPASNILVVDYIPAGLTLADSAWMGSGPATITIPGPLAPGASTIVPISFTVDASADPGTIVNVAEIAGAEDPDGNPGDDADSDADALPGNDAGGAPGTPSDDSTDGDGSGAPGDTDPATDEDDQDPASVTVVEQPISLGDTVFLDEDNSGTLDAGESGIPGVTVNLWTADAAGSPVMQVATTVTDGSGSYLFDGLPPGDYIVQIPNQTALDDLASSTGNGPAPDPDDDVEDDDNGDPVAGLGVLSPVITLTVGGEPTGDNGTDGSATDDSGNNTLDFGFFEPIFDLALTKAASGATTVQPGSTVTFDIEVTNQGDLPAMMIMVSDYVPAGLTLADANWSLAGTTATQVIPGPLAPGASVVLPISFTVDAGTPAGTIVNIAEISSAMDPDGPADDVDSTPDTTPDNDAGGAPGSPSDNVTGGDGSGAPGDTDPATDEDDSDPEQIEVVETPVFDLALRKILTSAGPFAPGDSVTFEIEVINQGTVGAQNITVVDYIPAGLTLDDTAWTAAAGIASQTIGSIAAGSNVILPITFTIDADAAGEIVNIAEISAAEDTDGNPGNDTDSTPDTNPSNEPPPVNDAVNDPADEDDHDPESITVTPPPAAVFDLALRKVLDTAGTAMAGDTVTFSIEVFNQGSVDAQNIVVVDYIPAGLTLADATWSASAGAATTTIAGPIAPGASETVTISFTVDADAAPGTIINFSEIASAEDPDGNPGVDVDSTLDALPGNDGTPVDNAINDPTDEDDHDPAPVEIGGIFDLALIKEISPGQTPVAGGQLQYTITVVNQGTIPAANIDIADAIPPELTLNDPNWQQVGTTASLTLPGPLAPGASTQVTITFDISPSASGQVINFAEIALAEDTAGNIPDDIDSDPDTDPTNDGTPIDNALDDPADEDDHDPATFTLTPPQTPGIALEKTVYLGHDSGAGCTGSDLETTVVGGDVTYCFEVTNTGDTFLNDIVLNDTTLGLTRTDLTLLSGTEPLAPSATLVFYVEVAASGDLVNTANTSGNPTDENGTDIPGLQDPTDEDPAEVVVGTPDILLLKTVYLGHDGGASCPGSELVTGSVGADVTYCFEIRNTGNLTLSNVLLTDNDIDPAVNVNLGTLAPGASAFHSVEDQLDVALVNTAGTSGTPSTDDGTPIPGAPPVTDTDPAEVRPLEVASLGDVVWNDLNANGVQDSGEPGVEGITVFLLDAGGNQIGSTVTDATGAYSFTGLPLGTYSVQFDVATLPADFVITDQNIGDDSLDSDVDTTTGLTAPVTLTFDGENNPTLDMGIWKPACIGDVVWNDLSCDGSPADENLAEFGFTNVTVSLFSIDELGAATFIDSMLTDTQGQYLFEGLVPGTYRVVVNTSDVPSFALEMPPSTPLEYTVTLESCECFLGADFGFCGEPTAIGLASFTATQEDDGVYVEWVTAWEDGTLGFYIAKVDADGNETVLNDRLILADGTGVGGTYSFFDEGAEGGRYRLIELEVDLDLIVQDGDAIAAVDASPAAGDVEYISLEGEGPFTLETDGARAYLLTGFDGVPQVIDVTNPDAPYLLEGEVLQVEGESGFYFSYEAGKSLEASSK